MLNEQVRKIMTKHPATANPGDSIEQVSNLMVEKELQQLPVIEDGKFVGLITSHDLWRNSRNPQNKNNTTVRDIMTTNVIKITPLDKVGTAAELFMDRRFKTLPVVNLKNELKGVITAFDLIKHVLQKEYPEPILYGEVINGDF